ncbi:MAG: hypothetical protein ABL904_14100 [Hyphomicrobiaceae bacterium]
MRKRKQSTGQVGGIAARQASIGVFAGMALALLLKGYATPPVTAAYAAVASGGSILQMAEKLREGQYRVTTHCPMKHQRATYHVKAEDAEDAQAALEWVMPACKLAAMGQGQAANGGLSWYAGQFKCQGDSYRRTHNVGARDLMQARERTRSIAPGCRIEIVDQIECAALEPLCDRQYEDFKIEAELERTHLLR